jgi:hypothetical protein
MRDEHTQDTVKILRSVAIKVWDYDGFETRDGRYGAPVTRD